MFAISKPLIRCHPTFSQSTIFNFHLPSQHRSNLSSSSFSSWLVSISNGSDRKVTIVIDGNSHDAMQRNVFQCIVFSTVQCKAVWQCNVRICDSVGSTLPLVKVTVLSLAYNTIRPCAQRRRHSSKLNVNIGDNAVTTLPPHS